MGTKACKEVSNKINQLIIINYQNLIILLFRYYDKLFKEYTICDLSRYKENKIANRWRVEKVNCKLNVRDNLIEKPYILMKKAYKCFRF